MNCAYRCIIFSGRRGHRPLQLFDIFCGPSGTPVPTMCLALLRTPLQKLSIMPEGHFKWRSHISSAKRISKIPQGIFLRGVEDVAPYKILMVYRPRDPSLRRPTFVMLERSEASRGASPFEDDTRRWTKLRMLQCKGEHNLPASKMKAKEQKQIKKQRKKIPRRIGGFFYRMFRIYHAERCEAYYADSRGRLSLHYFDIFCG